jgi:predicted helicase
MSALNDLLATYRNAAVSEREKGTYFEELIVIYLRNEATYRDLYSHVWTYANWAVEQGIDGRDNTRTITLNFTPPPCCEYFGDFARADIAH